MAKININTDPTTKEAKKLAAANQCKQLSLFEEVEKICAQEEQAPATGSCNIQFELKETIAKSMSSCKLSRYEIAGAISNLLGMDISKYQLDAWVAESKDGHRLPAEYLVAFCRVVGSYEPLNLICKKLGLFIMPGSDALRSEIHKLEEEIGELMAEKERRVDFLQKVIANV